MFGWSVLCRQTCQEDLACEDYGTDKGKRALEMFDHCFEKQW